MILSQVTQINGPTLYDAQGVNIVKREPDLVVTKFPYNAAKR